MNIRRLAGAALLAFGALVATADLASAAAFSQTHPRRAEVNHRLALQRHRIAHKLHAGRMAPKKARRLRASDRRLREEERFMARAHHGAITRAEQKALNQQENEVSRKISR